MHEFCPSHNKVMQIAYVVPDLEAAVQAFAMQLNIGGWVIVEKMEVRRMMYRGSPSDLTLKIGLAYQGHMMYDFIQSLSDVPSVYKDKIDDRLRFPSFWRARRISEQGNVDLSRTRF